MTTRVIDFVVSGEQKIHCEGCEQRIGNALRRLSGVEDVRASAKSQRVEVKLDPDQVDPEEVRDRLEQLGYEVTPQKGAA
jgi:copper chaperone CopZ